MSFCIRATEYDPDIHEIVSGPNNNCNDCNEIFTFDVRDKEPDPFSPDGEIIRFDSSEQLKGVNFSVILIGIEDQGLVEILKYPITNLTVENETKNFDSFAVKVDGLYYLSLLEFTFPPEISEEDFDKIRIKALTEDRDSVDITVLDGLYEPNYSARKVYGIMPGTTNPDFDIFELEQSSSSSQFLSSQATNLTPDLNAPKNDIWNKFWWITGTCSGKDRWCQPTSRYLQRDAQGKWVIPDADPLFGSTDRGGCYPPCPKNPELNSQGSVPGAMWRTDRDARCQCLEWGTCCTGGESKSLGLKNNSIIRPYQREGSSSIRPPGSIPIDVLEPNIGGIGRLGVGLGMEMKGCCGTETCPMLDSIPLGKFFIHKTPDEVNCCWPKEGLTGLDKCKNGELNKDFCVCCGDPPFESKPYYDGKGGCFACDAPGAKKQRGSTYFCECPNSPDGPVFSLSDGKCVVQKKCFKCNDKDECVSEIKYLEYEGNNYKTCEDLDEGYSSGECRPCECPKVGVYPGAVGKPLGCGDEQCPTIDDSSTDEQRKQKAELLQCKYRVSKFMCTPKQDTNGEWSIKCENTTIEVNYDEAKKADAANTDSGDPIGEDWHECSEIQPVKICPSCSSPVEHRGEPISPRIDQTGCVYDIVCKKCVNNNSCIDVQISVNSKDNSAFFITQFGTKSITCNNVQNEDGSNKGLLDFCPEGCEPSCPTVRHLDQDIIGVLVNDQCDYQYTCYTCDNGECISESFIESRSLGDDSPLSCDNQNSLTMMSFPPIRYYTDTCESDECQCELPCDSMNFNNQSIQGVRNDDCECEYELSCTLCSECPKNRVIKVKEGSSVFGVVNDKSCSDFTNKLAGVKYKSSCSECAGSSSSSSSHPSEEPPQCVNSEDCNNFDIGFGAGFCAESVLCECCNNKCIAQNEPCVASPSRENIGIFSLNISE
jgi:hypothetical protein